MYSLFGDTTLEFLLTLLERLPKNLRGRVIAGACRIHPSLLHPSLAHDPTAVCRLEMMLRQASGLTIIQGQEHLRPFLLGAMANSVRRVQHRKVPVHGLETQVTPFTQPIGVTNTQSYRDADLLNRRVSELKQAPEGSLILLGGDWWKVNGLEAEVGRLATRCNVVAADAPVFNQISSLSLHPIQVITLSRVREQPEWIQVAFQDGKA